VHDLVLDVEVEFATQEAAQVLVNEVVESVAGCVAAQVRLQTGVIRLFAVGACVCLAEFGDPSSELAVS